MRKELKLFKVINGKYAPYVELYNSKAKGKKKKTFFKIPRDKQDESIIKKMTLEEVKDIMKNQPKENSKNDTTVANMLL